MAVSSPFITGTTEYHLICVNQSWSSIQATVYVLALLFHSYHRRLAAAVITWVSKPTLFLFSLQFFTLGIGINHYVLAMDSLPTVVLVTASLPAVGYLSRFASSCSRAHCSSKTEDVAVAGRILSPSGADVAASNCLLALAVLRLALDQPEADLASAVPIWLLILHSLPLLWYWMEANVKRYAKKHSKVGLGQKNGCGQTFRLSRKLLRVTLTARNFTGNSCGDVTLQTVERITVV